MNGLWYQAHQAYLNGQLRQAWRLCDELIQVDPLNADGLRLMGALALKLEEPEVARGLFALLVERSPHDEGALLNLGSSFHSLGQFDAALATYQRVVSLNPASAAGWYNMANTLKALGRLSQACDAYDQSIRLKADYQEAHYNWANTLHQMGRFEAAIAQFDRALELCPGDDEARKNRSFSRLMIGDYVRGWDDYEARWNTEPMVKSAKPRGCPLWTGEQSLVGRTILLHAEQGLGDTLQFCRFARMVKELGAALVILEVQPPLMDLLRGLNGVDVLVPAGLSVPAMDVHCPLMSLPRALGITPQTIPYSGAYLDIEADCAGPWVSMLNPSTFNIGICWSGSVKGQEVGKSIPVSAFKALADIPGVELYSLQKGAVSVGEENGTHPAWLRAFGPDFDSVSPFMDTATVMRALDLVISTDTSVPHLAAALGVPVWVALPWLCDWRWGPSGSTTPWYDTMRLFRQYEPGRWDECFREIGSELVRLV